MDRLSAVALAALALAACDKDAPQPPPSRVEGAKVGSAKAASTDAFCDIHTTDDSGATLVFPALVGDPPPAQTAGHWRWLNVWATWCKPCIEELPRLVRWQSKLAAAGRHVDFAFVSLDDNDADVAEYRHAHPETPATARLADPAKQADWFTSLGLAAASVIPLHVFVGPTGHIRCVRSGSVREQDYAAIERLLGE